MDISPGFPARMHPRASCARRILMVVCIAGLPGAAGAASSRDYDLFAAGDSSSHTVYGDSLALAARDTQTVKFLGDTVLSAGGGYTRAGDVIAVDRDRFLFLWAESSLVQFQRHDLYAAEMQLSRTTVTPGTPARMREEIQPPASYLHAASGASHYLSVHLENSFRSLYACNAAGCVEAAGGSNLFTSLCPLENDTFLVIYKKELRRHTLKKCVSGDGGLSWPDSVVVARSSGTNADALTNCSVAADEQGTILALWMHGGHVYPDKTIAYKLLDRSFATLDSGRLYHPVSDPEDINFYDDAPVVSYAPGKFAAVTWNGTGIQLHQCTVSGSSLQVHTHQVESSAGVAFPTIAVGGGKLVVAWKALQDNPERVRIDGRRYVISSGDFTVSAGESFTFADIAASVPESDGYLAPLNIAVDTRGSMAFAWPTKDTVWSCIWARRAVFFPRAYWTSAVDSVPAAAGDSVVFRQGTVVMDDAPGDAEVYVQAGSTVDPSEISAWGDWALLTDAAQLRERTAGENRYFRYHVVLNRDNADSIQSPVLRSITIPWNAQPKLVSVDSVIVGNRMRDRYGFSDTVDVLSRSETVRFHVRLWDADTNDALTVTTTLTSAKQTTLTRENHYFVSESFPVLPRSDTVYTCTFEASDQTGWEGVARELYVRTANDVPELAVDVSWDSAGTGTRGTMAMPRRMGLSVQEGDSAEFSYAVTDRNDPDEWVFVVLDGDTVDSIQGGTQGRYVFYGDDLEGYGYADLRFQVSDPDTGIEKRATIAVNHEPVIDSVYIDGAPVGPDDTVRVTIGADATCFVTVNDSDARYWDSLTYRFVTSVFDSLQAESVFTFVPTRADSALRIIVHDLFARADTFDLVFKYPWWTRDSTEFSGYATAKRLLRDSLSLIVGAGTRDSVGIPLRNGGNDTMSITAVRFSGDPRGWLSVELPQGEGRTVFDSLPEGSAITPMVIEPESSTVILVRVNTDAVEGDGYLLDTLIIRTSDPNHPLDTLPLRLEHNELPVVVDVAPAYDAGTPQWLAKSRRGMGDPARAYVFPAHAGIRVRFSEPMDTASARSALTVYSVPDSQTAGTTQPIDLMREWSDRDRQVVVRADYASPSPHFGLRPPSGSFIPTDSIILLINSGLTDTAATVSGPNGLDVNRDFARDFDADTALPLAVDSITFALDSVYPRVGLGRAETSPAITLTFNGPVYSGSIDTSRAGNRSLTVTSRYSGGAVIDFDSVSVSGNTAVFHPARRFYFDDSVHCVYHGVTARDSLGYPVDMSDDGIAAALYDSSSTIDNFAWYFRIRPVRVVSVEPDSGSSGASIRQAVTLRFSEKLFPHTIDTDSLRGNRSLKVTTGRDTSTTIQFKRIRIAADSLSVTFEPESTFFARDSVYCRFVGFSGDFRYDSLRNLPKPGGRLTAGYAWHFFTKNVGFYTYPNPYRPATDPRHCGEPGAPCGIWFKNLHTLLGRRGGELTITVMDMNGYPVYDTRDDGVRIRYASSTIGLSPQWKWDTRNRRGELVAPGLYFYAIADGTGKVLTKGKLLIVR